MDFPGLKISVKTQPIRISPKEGTYIKAIISRFMNMTQNEFALSIGMDRGQLSGYLSGKRTIEPRTLKKILNGIQFQSEGETYQYEPKWETHIVIRPSKIGPTVLDADYMPEEEQSQL